MSAEEEEMSEQCCRVIGHDRHLEAKTGFHWGEEERLANLIVSFFSGLHGRCTAAVRGRGRCVIRKKKDSWE